MYNLKKIMIVLVIIFISIPCISTVALSEDKLPDILIKEMNREMEALQKQETPPYFISYRVDDIRNFEVRASFGNVNSSEQKHNRYLTTQVRVGDYKLDNTHEIRGSSYGGYYGSWLSMIPLPMDDDEKSIAATIWYATNDEYQKAVDKYANVKANKAVKVAEEDTSADFSGISEKAVYIEPKPSPEMYRFDKKKWEEKLNKYTAVFLKENDIYIGNAYIDFNYERRYFLSTEGAKIAQNRFGCRLIIHAAIKAEDGMELPLYKSYFSYNPDGLPDDDIILKDVNDMVVKLRELRDAPVVDPYTGPALLSGRSSGVFFHEIFGHRIEGHRQKSEYEGQTFKNMVGKKVLPDHMSIVFDPSLKSHRGVDLNGYYIYDDEGVKGEKVTVVDKGILTNFLMCRSPIENFDHSNGHGRAQTELEPVSRQSNLIVETTNPMTHEQLRQALIDECKNQGLEYGYLFEDITGGFTITGRTIPNSFNVMPTEVYRVYVDGRPDELVRGVDIVGTPLSVFSQISEAGDDYEVFNGICGAESGGVPVSSASPSIFVKRIELQKKNKSQDRPPLLKRPVSNPD